MSIYKIYSQIMISRELNKRFGTRVKDLSDPEKCVFLSWVRILDRNMPEIKITYDIGANDGFTSKLLSIYTNNNVYAFEPLPEFIKYKRDSHIFIQPVACGDKNGFLYMNKDKFSPSSSLLKMTGIHIREWPNTGTGMKVKILVNRLDDWKRKNKLPYPDLLLIDVQGYENNVLSGADRVLHHTKYVWIELNFKKFYRHGSTFHSVYTQLTDLGFTLIDCVDLIYSRQNHNLLYMDGIFKNTRLSSR